jgi:hypothetical protein
MKFSSNNRALLRFSRYLALTCFDPTLYVQTILGVNHQDSSSYRPEINKMCFNDPSSNDDDDTAHSVRVVEYRTRSRSHRITFSPRFRRRCPSPPPCPLPLPRPKRIITTTIIYSPCSSGPFPHSHSHCSPPPSPRESYTTITRRHVRTRQETIYPVGLHTECLPASRYVEYVEPCSDRRRLLGRAWEEGEVEYIPIR